jgi:hypothetical protein
MAATFPFPWATRRPPPAFWFFDMAEVDPAQSGVIAFVNAEGVLIRHLRPDASKNAIITGLEALLLTATPRA